MTLPIDPNLLPADGGASRSTQAALFDLVALAKGYLSSGAYKEAETYAREAAEHSLEAKILHASILRRMGRHDEAAHLRQQIPVPDDADLQAELKLLDIGLLIDAGQYRQCIDRFDVNQALAALRISDIRMSMDLGICHFRLNDNETARSHFAKAVQDASMIGWKEGVAGGLLNMGLTERVDGLWHQAEEHLLSAKLIFGELGLMRGYNLSSLNLGLQRLWQGNLKAAMEDLWTSARLAREMGDIPTEASAHMDCGLALARMGRTTDARSELARALRLCRHQASPRRLAIALEYTGELHIAEKDWNRASACLKRALKIANRIAPDGDIVPEVLRRLAEVALGTGHPGDALTTAQDAATRALVSGDRYEHATALRVIGQALRLFGRESEAAQNYRSALATLEELGETFERERVITLLEAPTQMASDAERPAKRTVRLDSSHTRELRRLLAQHGMVGSSRPLLDLMRQIERIAPIHLPVLIQGETGSGKELVACAIHRIGAVKGSPLVAFNCATCPPDLLDAELFGHVKGAFTGAHRARPGLVRSAQGGSLFLDEIGELREESQARLLRLLDSGEIRPLGSDQSIRIDVRMIAATHVDLRKRIEGRRFRQDLYFRLSGIRLLVPALRDRAGDVRELVEHFTGEARAKVRPAFAGFGEKAIRAMEKYSWPGNIRQLRMEVLRVAAMAPEGSIVENWDIPEDSAKTDRLDQDEATSILQNPDRLQAFVRDLDGQMSDIARRLGISRGHLYRVFKKTGIRVQDYRPR